MVECGMQMVKVRMYSNAGKGTPGATALTAMSMRNAGRPKPSAFVLVSSSSATTIMFFTPAERRQLRGSPMPNSSKLVPHRASSSTTEVQLWARFSAQHPAAMICVRSQAQYRQATHSAASTHQPPMPPAPTHTHSRQHPPARLAFSAHTLSMPPGQA